MADIVMIPIDHLNAHPDNPRKDLGDLSELAESIKAKGILQNLTVVPYYSQVQHRTMDGMYTVLIGHRRAEAARLAGLTEVPCTVVEMSYEDQIATMLVENIQRSDLTVYEEAKGFQMMLDLGKSVKEVSDMSGFSETTVRSRAKLAKLDEKKFKKAVERGATLFDFAELDKIEDEKVRDDLLKVIGTANWKNELAFAIKKQKEQALKVVWLDQVSKWAEQIEGVTWGSPYSKAIKGGKEFLVTYYRSIDTYSQKDEKVDLPEDLATATYYYVRKESGDIVVYKSVSDEDQQKDAAEEAAQREKSDRSKAKQKKFEEITERHRKLRFDFVKEFNQFQKRDANVWEFVTEAMIYGKKNGGGYANSESTRELAKILGVKWSDKTESLDYHEFLTRKMEKPEQTALLTAMWIMDVGKYWQTRWNGDVWICIPAQNENLDRLYQLLDTLGYQRSTEENEMRNGTHKLFDKEES